MTTVSKQAIREASAWLVELNSDEATNEDQRRWQQWHQQSEENRAAWSQIERFKRQFQDLPTEIVHHAIDGADERRRQRRILLKSFAAIALLGPVAYTGYRQTSWHADYQTAVGEIKTLQLADKTELTLNTDTAIDIDFNRSERQVRLLRGEVFVATAKSATESRPFVIGTHQGRVRALGTRFSVYSNHEYSRVNVLEHAILIEPNINPDNSLRLEAGYVANFDRQRIRNTATTDETHVAWTRRMLIVDNWSLDKFITELSRYRPGHLVCRDSVAELRISGSFPLDNTDHILDSLPKILPVRIRYMTRYWVSIDKG